MSHKKELKNISSHLDKITNNANYYEANKFLV